MYSWLLVLLIHFSWPEVQNIWPGAFSTRSDMVTNASCTRISPISSGFVELGVSPSERYGKLQNTAPQSSDDGPITSGFENTYL